MSKPKTDAKKPTYRIPAEGPWANAWKIAMVFAAVGGAGCALGAMSDPHRFAFSWLFAFMCFLAIGLGGLFFVIAQHLTGAGWGVPVRRTAEFLMVGLPVFLLLFVPIAYNMDQLYPWMHIEAHEEGEEGEGHEEHGEPADAHGDEHGALSFGATTAHAQEARDPEDVHPNEREPGTDEHTPEHAAHHAIIVDKLGFLDQGFFFVRAGIYFLAWILLSFFFFTWSTRQDKEKGLSLTQKAEALAPGATFIFGLTLTFAAFDWMMSLEPSWFSTIFGVIYFAISAVISLAVITLISLGLRGSGHLGEAVNVEHLHDVGKLLHGFLVFWAYVSFSQFMLIWYAGIPEESTYFHLRWWGGGGFMSLTTIMIVAGFVIPFFLLMSRNVKRHLPMLGFGAAWVAVMHVVQMYWLVMPYADQTGLVETQLRLHWMDVASLFAVGGTYFAFVFWNMTRYPLIPVGDPRIERGLHHVVV